MNISIFKTLCCFFNHLLDRVGPVFGWFELNFRFWFCTEYNGICILCFWNGEFWESNDIQKTNQNVIENFGNQRIDNIHIDVILVNTSIKHKITILKHFFMFRSIENTSLNMFKIIALFYLQKVFPNRLSQFLLFCKIKWKRNSKDGCKIFSFKINTKYELDFASTRLETEKKYCSSNVFH